MIILERRIQKLAKGKTTEEFMIWEKKWDVIERRLDINCPKRHSIFISGGESLGTTVWEREWESFAALEAAYAKSDKDPEAQELGKNAEDILTDIKIEFYWLVEE